MTDREFAEGAGWKVATDYDTVPHTMVVYHPIRGIHYTGDDAWAHAAAWSRSEPVKRLWTITGTIHMAGGFELHAGAAYREGAEAIIEETLNNLTPGELVERFGVELQEVCIQNAVMEEDDAP